MTRSWLPFGTALQATATPPRAWQASSVVKNGNPASLANMLKRQEAWQKRVLTFADAIPEVANTGSYLHNTMNLVSWRVEGTASPEHIDIIERGLETFMAGRVAENVFYVGEMLASWEYDAAKGRVVWDTFSHAEWKTQSGVVKIMDDAGEFVIPEDTQKVFRIHRQDREIKTRAYSPHKSMIEMLQAWYLHTLVDTRLAQSRLAGAGILHIPGDDLQSMPLTGDGEPANGSREQFMDEFIESMLTPITDSTTDDAVVPFLMFGKADNVAALKHVLMERVDDPAGFKQRMDAYAERYARGVDLPNEILLGTGDANHWTAWKIDDDTATYYINPAAKRIAAPLTRNYAMPLLRVLGGTGDVSVVPDLTEIIARPDKSESAAKAFENGAITREAYVREIGLSDDDIDDVGVPIGSRQATGVNMPQTFTHSPPPGA